jgi:hypothetical protein
MLSYVPIIAIILAIIAAGSIACIAWKLTSDRHRKSVDDTKQQDRTD